MLFSELSLYAATREQTIASWNRTAVEWGTGLTLEEYVDREFVGEKREFARDGKQITWVLAPRNNPTTLDFLCSCETFKRKIAISRPSQDGNVEPILEYGFGYGIASVFTSPQNRGKGYGKHMMRLLHWVLAREEYLVTQTFPEDEWGARPPRVPDAGDAFVAALWSDVGPTFYQECGMGKIVERGDGWVIRDPFSTVWEVREVNLSGIEEGEVMWLDEESAKAIWRKDAARIETEVVQTAKSQDRTRTYFSFLPNEGVAEFQWFRLHYHFSRYVSNPPQYCGLQVGKGGAFATWTCDFRTESSKAMMVLTRLRANEEEIEGLIVQVLRYAREHGLNTVETWNLAPNLRKVLGQYGGSLVERDEHFPAIKWYEDENVEWLYNERFCWC